MTLTLEPIIEEFQPPAQLPAPEDFAGIGKPDGRKGSCNSGVHVAPLYPDNAQPIGDARHLLDASVQSAMTEAREWNGEGEPPVNAIRIGTGIGKTTAAANAVSREIQNYPSTKPFVVAVPTHRLGDEIVSAFERLSVSAAVFRGREANDPQTGRPMCDDLPAVSAAIALGESVETSVCKGPGPDGKEAECRFFKSCSYQRQKLAKPQVWVIAHQLLFKNQPAIDSPAFVFVDEGFWQSGLWKAKRGLTLDEIASPIPLGRADLDDVIASLEPMRGQLARALRRQDESGGLRRNHITAEGLTAEDCSKAIKLEWQLKPKADLWPGMPASRRLSALEKEGLRHVRSFAATWGAVRDLLEQPEGSISGRIVLADIESVHGKARGVFVSGTRAIATQWKVPTLLMDATLPETEILRKFYPAVRLAAEVEATMPHVKIRQIVDAPVSSGKLQKLRNLESIRRVILRRFLDVGRKPTVVIAQKAAADWLRDSGLPPGISVEHFNALAGLDQHKGVRLLICVGRTLPDLLSVEDLAGRLSGLEPVKTEAPAEGPRWYRKAVRGIRMESGEGYGIEADEHPDPLAEAVRWQICEAELIQAIGRARGVNRAAESPLDIDLMADVVLPVTAAAVVTWRDMEALSGSEVEMEISGIALESPGDMAKAWPSVWATPKAAERWGERRTKSTDPQFPIENILYRSLGACGRYQHRGARQRWRSFRYDPRLIPDPKAWLESRLDGLARVDLGEGTPDSPPVLARPKELPPAPCEVRRETMALRSREDRSGWTEMEVIFLGASPVAHGRIAFISNRRGGSALALAG